MMQQRWRQQQRYSRVNIRRDAKTEYQQNIKAEELRCRG
jgi:hypothetical protein